MQAAITANDRGHEVILVEKNLCLGGALLFTDVDAHKKDLKRFKDYLICQVNKRKIDVKLNTIIIIDDIYTTGNTVNECAKILIQEGIERTNIGVLTLAKD